MAEAQENKDQIEISYGVEEVSNFFIKKGLESGRPINPMKLQKLLYFSYGWYSAFMKKKLFDEPIQAWRYGPVIEKIYHEVKVFGNNPIDKLVEKYETPSSGFGFSFKAPEIKFKSKEDEQFLDAIFLTFGKVSAISLSEKTHEEGSPWSNIAKKYGNDIPKGIEIPFEDIQSFFLNLKEKNNAK